MGLAVCMIHGKTPVNTSCIAELKLLSVCARSNLSIWVQRIWLSAFYDKMPKHRFPLKDPIMKENRGLRGLRENGTPDSDGNLEATIMNNTIIYLVISRGCSVQVC